MDKTDKEVLELCKSWFEDIAERSDRLTTGNVSHGGRAIHGVAMNYAEYVDEHLHNNSRWHKVAWGEEDEEKLTEIIGEFEAMKNNSPTIFEKNLCNEKITFLESLKERVKGEQHGNFL